MTYMASLFLASILLMVTFVYSSVPGGWNSMPLDSDILKNISDYAHEQISRRSNSAVYRRLIHLHEASSQVVAGINYKLVLDSGYTKCRRNGDATNEVISSCDLDKERKIERCTITIWDRSWLNDRQVLDFKCEPFASHDEYFNEYQTSDRKFHQAQST